MGTSNRLTEYSINIAKPIYPIGPPVLKLSALALAKQPLRQVIDENIQSQMIGIDADVYILAIFIMN